MNDSPQPMWLDPVTDPNITYDSIPDQYNFRAGFSATVSQFAFSLCVRIDGMPVNNLIGDSDGFRRPGNIVYIEPAIVWSNIKNTVILSVPVAIHRDIKTSNYDSGLEQTTSGGLADYLIFLGYTRRF